jgi:Xaa-Pro aminopeptidase
MGVSEQQVGENFVLDSMKFARDRTWDVVNQLSAWVRPGMLESEATAECKRVMTALGMERIWHPSLVRFGANTLKMFNERSEGDPRLAENDIFFIDLGIVWKGHEGDAGATFVVGDDPEMIECAVAAQRLFDEVEAYWRKTGATGVSLYDYAERRANDMGWRLNLDIKGHRVSDFPHAVYKAGKLGDFAACPNVGLWILEIQIAHPTRPFGAFYEDLLI